MPRLMRCEYCGLLQDEPAGVKTCARCGGELVYEQALPGAATTGYLGVQIELDQVAAPAGQNVERYLLVTVRAPKDVPAGEMPPTKSKRPPVNFAAVLDNSGSMGGRKIEEAKQAVRHAARILHPGDVFSLVTFNTQVACPLEPAVVDDGINDKVDACLGSIRAGGQTALDGGLALGIAKAQEQPLETNLVMLLSDGQTNVGEQDLEVIGARALAARQQGMVVSALGIGSDYNEALLAEIAMQGGGRFYHIQNAAQISPYVSGELGEAAMFAARDVRLRLAIPAGATIVPLSAAYPVTQAAEDAIVAVGDIPCDTELEIPLRLALVGAPAGSKLSISGRLTFRSPAGHDLEMPLNRVTVRFTAPAQFTLREGVVAPVVERVYEQMKAASVLGVARTTSHRPGEAQQQRTSSYKTLIEYASLLGEERAQKESERINEQFASLSNPTAAKFAVSEAFATQRRSKKFPD